MVMNWMQVQWSQGQLHWIHEISQSALALAVVTLGVVILLELASIARLRRTMDGHLQRVFEQLDLLRGDSQQLIEAHSEVQSRVPPAAKRRSPAPAAPNATPPEAAAAYTPPALGAGEAKLLAALAAARARLGQREGS